MLIGLTEISKRSSEKPFRLLKNTDRGSLLSCSIFKIINKFKCLPLIKLLPINILYTIQIMQLICRNCCDS